MRSTFLDVLEEYRVQAYSLDHANAWFLRKGLRVKTSNGGGWDHVSVSLATRCPTWDEMCLVNRSVFEPTEVTMQLHPAAAEYRNNHAFCLHIWRPQTADELTAIRLEWEACGEAWPADWSQTSYGEIPFPPASMVAPESSSKSPSAV